jgi:hypothetical protein
MAVHQASAAHCDHVSKALASDMIQARQQRSCVLANEQQRLAIRRPLHSGRVLVCVACETHLEGTRTADAVAMPSALRAAQRYGLFGTSDTIPAMMS